CFITTRLVLFAVGTLAVSTLPINAAESRSFHLAPQPHSVLEAWARYDACWYVTIAERGYRGPLGWPSDLRPGFLPLFPALIRVVAPVSGTWLAAGLIVSNVCLFAFLLVLWHLVERDWSASVARRVVLVYLLFPSAFFLSGAYSESLALLLSAGALLFA